MHIQSPSSNERLDQSNRGLAEVEISIVVPLFNEQDNLRPLYHQLTETLADKYNYELIFVDDGSTDNSFTVLTHLAEDRP